VPTLVHVDDSWNEIWSMTSSQCRTWPFQTRCRFSRCRRLRRRSQFMNEVLPKLSTSTCLSTLFVDCARSLLHPQTLPLVLCCRRQRTPMLCRMKPFWEVPRPVRPASVFTVLPTSLHRQLSVVTSAMLSASILQLLLIIVIYTELSLQL